MCAYTALIFMTLLFTPHWEKKILVSKNLQFYSFYIRLKNKITNNKKFLKLSFLNIFNTARFILFCTYYFILFSYSTLVAHYLTHRSVTLRTENIVTAFKFCLAQRDAFEYYKTDCVRMRCRMLNSFRDASGRLGFSCANAAMLIVPDRSRPTGGDPSHV